MRRIAGVLVAFTLFVGVFRPIVPRAQEKAWWKEGPVRPPAPDPLAKSLPLIRVAGNRFVDPQGQPVLFRGLSISDPDKIEAQGQWRRELFARVKELGARIVRIPVHPVAWRQRTPAGYLVLLDQAVRWCTELGMYVIIDWHSIGNLEMELFQDPMYDTSRKETFEFWRAIAQHFSGHNTVAFYEIFNEPTDFRGRLGTVSWTEWRELNEKIIRLIRAYDKETIPLVAGFDWAYDLTPLRYEPVQAESIGYVTHPYPMKREEPWEPKWEEDFAFAASQYPLFATEWGFWLRPGEKISEGHYGRRIVKFLEERGISWAAWVFDPEWSPRMLESWEEYRLTPYGQFIGQILRRSSER